MSHLYYCKKCKQYSLNSICSNCEEKTISKYPARYSPQDHYGKYRRMLKKQNRGE